MEPGGGRYVAGSATQLLYGRPVTFGAASARGQGQAAADVERGTGEQAVPGPPWLRIMVPLLAIVGSVFIVTIYADDIRVARLRQHGLPVPDDPDLGDTRAS